MHIPIKVDYGVRALLDLAQHREEGVVRSADIARRQFIPEPFLDRLLNTMSKSDLVRSYRGPQGGHALGADPSRISLAMVMSALGETGTMVGCLEDPALCTFAPACSQRNIWREVEDAVQAILDRTTIADLVQRLAGSAAPVEEAPAGGR